MRTIPACAFVALTSLAAACGGGGDATPDAAITIIDSPEPDAFVPPPPDAQVFDFTCSTNPAPTTAAATVTLSGTAQNINIIAMALEPVADADVSATKSPDTELPPNTTSDDLGNWTLAPKPTLGVPLDGFITAAKDGHQTIRVFPPEPITADQANIPALLLSDATFGLVQQVAGKTQDPTKGTILLAIVDCANTPINGATISAKQAGVEQGEQYDLSQIQPGTGAWLVFNVPVGDTEVNATINGVTLRAHTVGVAADATSATIVNPGFAN